MSVFCGALWALAAAPIKQGLDDYRPQHRVSGVIRSRGSNQMAALMKRWEAGFRKYHPEICFLDRLKGSASGIYGLEVRTADIALMGRPINPFERYGSYERAWVYPVEIEVATGSSSVPHKSPAYAIFVHKDNPLSRLTLKQLDGIFGAQRGGGWKALTWDESAARTSADNLRNWGQLGLGGAWVDRPIHVYGPPNLGAGTITYFQTRVMGGGAFWNEDLREYADRKQMIGELGRDPYGIGYAALDDRTPAVKPIAVSDGPAGPFVLPDRKSVASRTYPLSRPVYIVYTIDNEKSEIAAPRVDPKIKEFLRYILSREGQADVEREGSYLPLTRAVVREQLSKLESEEMPRELELLREE